MTTYAIRSCIEDESRHSERRRNQRGIKKDVVELIMSAHDMEIPRGDGCSALRISRQKAIDLRKEGVPCQLVDQAAHIAILINRNWRTVSCITVHEGRKGRSYRRSQNGRRNRGRRRH